MKHYFHKKSCLYAVKTKHACGKQLGPRDSTDKSWYGITWNDIFIDKEKEAWRNELKEVIAD